MINKIKQWVDLVWTYITNNENYAVVKAFYKIANEVANKTGLAGRPSPPVIKAEVVLPPPWL